MTTPGRVAIALAWALAWGLAVPASAVVFARAGCPDQVATALTLALPLEDADLAPGELHSRLEAALEQAAPAPAGAVDDPCVGQRKVQVNVAFGSSYQVLDWLSRRQVDGGVVTPFGLSLLARDEVEVVPLVWKRTGAPVSLAGSGEISRPWSGPVRSTLRAGIWRAGRLEPLAGAAELWREYREEVWCRAVREISGAELEAQRTRCSDRPPSGRRLRPVMPSHLSSGGFVAPVGGLGRWLDARLAAWQAELGDGGTGTSSEAVLRVQGEVRGAFWRGFFEDLRLTLDHQPVDRLAADSRDARRPLDLVPVGGGSEEIELLVSERSAADASEEPLPWDDSVGSPADLLVLLPSVHTAGAAEPQRIVQRLPVGFPSLPEQDEVLLYRRQAPAERPEIVASWASAAEPERYFGTRTFDFTADEALRLLRLHRRVVPEQRLALVLPGGGVKAAYQSVLLDELYGSGALRNRRAEGSSATTDPPLAVDEVVGTSGGSLIGYFVAQLDSPGRPLLSQVLWQRSDDELLSSLDIFGWLDQLRWLSFIVAFGGLCLVLALASLHRRGRGARESGAVANRSASDPAGDGVAAVEEGRAGPSWRPAVLWAFGPLLVLTPIAVRWLSGDASREEVPEIEGLLFALLVWLAMFADQCLIDRRGGRRPAPPAGFSPRALILAGVLMMALPVLVLLLSGCQRPLGNPADCQALPASSFGLTYAVLVLLAVFGGIAVPMRVLRRRAGSSARAVLGRAAVDTLLCAGGILLLPALSPRIRESMVSLSFILAALLLVVFVLGLSAVAYRRRAPRGITRAQRLGYYPAMVAVSALVAVLTAPTTVAGSLGEMLQRPSALQVSSGSLVFVLGALLLAAGMVLALHHDTARYRLEEVNGFGLALLVVLVHGVFTYLLLLGVVSIPLLKVTTLELTWEFWLALLTCALLTAYLLLRWGARSSSHWTVDCLRQGLGFLCEHHPNGVLLSWRFLRLAAVAVVFLGWWNLVVAPALYGNAHAESFLRLVQKRFQTQLTGGGDDLLPRFTTTFVTPANRLETDGTRFFTFVPGEESCPSLGSERGTGGAWYTYRVGSRWRSAAQALPQAGECTCYPVSDPEFYSDVIFASGSPFPIFAAHRVDPQCGRDSVLMVDGGYSNNVPVEAARKLDAQQVLILRSSHPLGHPGASGFAGSMASLLGEVPGQLISNLGPLTSFLFERSQRTDRQSGRELLVVSMAPRREHRRWPRLFDFRAEVVERMRRLACEDLGITEGAPCDAFVAAPVGEGGLRSKAQRIALVESWGLPEVQATVMVSEARPVADQDGPPAAR